MKLYFAPLDTLRTYAFFIVFISHVYFSFFRISEVRTRWFAHGEVGVQIFFILSAFLITYLSLAEYKKTGGFSVLHFFKKRILRIWPVYFLVLGASYIWHLISGHEQALGCAYRFVYFLGNTCMMGGFENVVGSQTLAPMWSVSVEQQFYVLFPLALVLYIACVKNMRKNITKYGVHTILILLFIYTLYLRYVHANSWNYISYSALASLPAFISGMYLAYAVHKRSTIINHVQRYATLYACTIPLAFLYAYHVKYSDMLGVSLYIIPIVYAVYVSIILSIKEKGEGRETQVSLLQKTTRHLGKISYGLYAYHMFAIVFVQYLFERTLPLFSSILSLAITVVLAQISYTYIELWFLKFKKSML